VHVGDLQQAPLPLRGQAWSGPFKRAIDGPEAADR